MVACCFDFLFGSSTAGAAAATGAATTTAAATTTPAGASGAGGARSSTAGAAAATGAATTTAAATTTQPVPVARAAPGVTIALLLVVASLGIFVKHRADLAKVRFAPTVGEVRLSSEAEGVAEWDSAATPPAKQPTTPDVASAPSAADASMRPGGQELAELYQDTFMVLQQLSQKEAELVAAVRRHQQSELALRQGANTIILMLVGALLIRESVRSAHIKLLEKEVEEEASMRDRFCHWLWEAEDQLLILQLNDADPFRAAAVDNADSGGESMPELEEGSQEEEAQAGQPATDQNDADVADNIEEDRALPL